MNTTTTVFQWIARIAGLIVIVLGILLWTGNFDQLKSIHMLFGITVVLALWALAVLGAFSGVGVGFVALAIVWGIIVPLLGITQESLFPGGAHWLIQILHLLLGLGAIGQAENLARRIKRRPTIGQTTSQAGTLKGAAQ
ncbi:MAG TPA: hypothetical protein VMV29_20265 [Ktedonobacterales bacterium]|nr:hypothetical protein [Ktedonobacterales bacterium]